MSRHSVNTPAIRHACSAKVQGARYFAQLHVRTAPGQTPQDALREFLGPLAEEVEIEDG